ncbi:hypothetical protein NDU88_005802 [Pleurodeles waltl]|uniref:Uncharacterized protein n=1 Tax=Pleurodeles waltl TaxID=8319 RepID=A0AAV7LNN7_PLEWA|nr:hypothetical protein NDU88_005802 [Pleurodeles waltl]
MFSCFLGSHKPVDLSIEQAFFDGLWLPTLSEEGTLLLDGKIMEDKVANAVRVCGIFVTLCSTCSMEFNKNSTFRHRAVFTCAHIYEKLCDKEAQLHFSTATIGEMVNEQNGQAYFERPFRMEYAKTEQPVKHCCFTPKLMLLIFGRMSKTLKKNCT